MSLAFVHRHDRLRYTCDLYTAYVREIRIIRRHRGGHARVCRYVPGMACIRVGHPNEGQSIACVEQIGRMRAARTNGRERHDVVRCEKSGDPLFELRVHDAQQCHTGWSLETFGSL